MLVQYQVGQGREHMHGFDMSLRCLDLILGAALRKKYYKEIRHQGMEIKRL